MSAKTSRIITFFLIGFLSGFIAWTVIAGTPFFITLAGIVGVILVLRVVRHFTKAIMFDERIQKINEKAAAASYRIFSVLMALASLVLISFSQSIPPVFGIIGQTLAYSVCALMLIQMGFYYFYASRF